MLLFTRNVVVLLVACSISVYALLSIIPLPESSNVTAKACGLGDRDSIPGRGKRFSSIPKSPERLWGPHSLLFNEYRRLFPGENGRGVKLTTHLHIMPRSRVVELYLHSPCLHGIVLN
jgi:hypothetical protein